MFQCLYFIAQCTYFLSGTNDIEEIDVIKKTYPEQKKSCGNKIFVFDPGWDTPFHTSKMNQRRDKDQKNKFNFPRPLVQKTSATRLKYCTENQRLHPENSI
jgi:hypothetical protein